MEHLYAGLDEPPLLLVQRPVVRRLVAGDALQLSVRGVRPAVVSAGERRGVALVVTAHRHAAVAARIQQHPDLARSIAHHDDRLAAHLRQEEIARLGDLAGVPDEEPGALENPRKLVLENTLVAEDLALDLPVLDG